MPQANMIAAAQAAINHLPDPTGIILIAAEVCDGTRPGRVEIQSNMHIPSAIAVLEQILAELRSNLP